MKMKMRFTALLTGAAMFCGAVPAYPVSAEGCRWTHAEGAEGDFEGLTRVDDKGVFANEWGSGYEVYFADTPSYYDTEITDEETGEKRLEHVSYDSYRMYIFAPRKQFMRIVLNSGLDRDAAEQQMLAVLENYYPNISLDASYHDDEIGISRTHYAGETVYDLWDKTETSGSAEIADGILHDLDAAGLISAFYPWGETASYNFQSGGQTLLIYPPDSFRPEAVQAYLDEHALNCTVTERNHEWTLGSEILTYTEYEIVPNEKMTFAEQFSIMADINEWFGYHPVFTWYEWYLEAQGQNALAKAEPAPESAAAGDLNCDGKLTVSDAILLARVLAEDTAVSVTPEGLQHADLNTSGAPDSDDLTLLLRQLAGIA